MKTAIIINLAYETQPIVKCRELWKTIETRMTKAGFEKNSRRFVTVMDPETACKQARGVIESIEAEYAALGQSAFAYIRDFYAVPYDKIINLAPPVSHSIEVDMMASGAFQKFFS
jgi:hypothetical protein